MTCGLTDMARLHALEADSQSSFAIAEESDVKAF